jgi:gliding motility-associated lipoprotein GldD
MTEDNNQIAEQSVIFPSFTAMLRYLVGFAFIVIGVSSCRPKVFTPKQPGYFRVDTPMQHAYQPFNNASFPYSFEYPVYGLIERDSAFFREKADNPYWLNINVPQLGGMINLTYKHFNNKAEFDRIVEDCYNLSFFHHEKADFIDEHLFRTAEGASGIIYVVGGNAASKYQFTITDSVQHFIRGDLYFYVTTNADSLRPANDFLFQDIQHLIQTLHFK